MPQNVNNLRKKSKYILFLNVKYVKMNQKFIKKSIKMTNWTTLEKYFFHFFLYSSVLSHNYFLHIKNSLYNVKKTLNIEKNKFSHYFLGAVFSKITNSNAQKWVIFRKKIFAAKLVLDILATFWGACFLKCHRRPTLVKMSDRR